MTHEESLKEYVEKDKIYQKYKLGVFPESDFERYCFKHCEDIEWALGEIKHLRELQKSMDKQYAELEKDYRDEADETIKLTELWKKAAQENQQLKENNQSYQEEMCKSWEKVDKYKSVLDEIREYIKYNATSNYFDADTNMFRREVDILQILDKVKE